MLFTCVSQLAQVEGGSLKIFYVPADHYCFHTLPQSSTFCFLSPSLLSPVFSKGVQSCLTHVLSTDKHTMVVVLIQNMMSWLYS